MNLYVENFMEFIALIFVTYMLLYTTYLFLSVLFGAVQLYENDQMIKLHNEIKHNYYLPISIIIPAYNEEVTIVDNIKSLLHLDYKLYEIIIVDDGSTDETSKRLLDFFPFQQTIRPIQRKIKCKKEEVIYEATINDINITLIRKINGGKSDALNMGINLSSYPYFVTVDADSSLQKNALKKIIQPILIDEEIIAVGGMVRVAQCVEMTDAEVYDYRMPWRPIIGMQVMEYDRSFLASRILLDQFNGNLIISGAFGLFKKDVVIAVGGYKTDTIGEDMELVMRLHTFMMNNKHSYKIRYHPDAICWSQSPESFRDIATQRRRWHLGLFQSLTSYPMMISRFRYKPVSFVSYLYYWIFEMLGPFIEVLGVSTIILAFYFDLLNVPFMINLFLIYTSYGVLLSLTSFFQRVYTQGLTLHVLDIVKAIIMVILENAIYRYILSFIRVTSLIGYKKKKHMWGSINRQKQSNHSSSI
ncbi:glycosyltransferase family 2 protein [Paraliobacillus sp. JSM ZJ581]|uniref:glycosyltransferase family 2 protein n=1 Tax=Paraliobacillus sp. JSM ZJ581 TaxID=3342118 RepID=UPI0035A95700